MAKKLALCGVFTALALIIYVVELSFPPVFNLPGVKIGFSNIITSVMLFMNVRTMGHFAPHEQNPVFSAFEVFAVMILRVCLGCVFAGRLSSLLPGLCGGVLALALGCVMRRRFSCVVTGVCSGAVHNAGQIFAVAFVYNLRSAVLYLPVLLVCGGLCGLVTGFVAMLTVRRLSCFKL
ncbi:hypothetical protein FACS1894120_0100 [Clostridia bacterium]|nr:hypothetical protein FACS1894120_0100 [Clostridia bacterium]